MIDINKYRVKPGATARLDEHDPSDKGEFAGGKPEGKAALPSLRTELAELQTRLWAESKQSVLVVIQAIDTGGKDGTIRHVFSGINPQGVKVHSFGRPTDEELSHDYLWRVHHHTPADGEITIFNRSHYEDVLVVRVKDLVPENVWERRYRHINEFERMLADEGTTIVKLFLNISKDEQRERLQARLDNPEKNWKFRKADLDDRAIWDDYQKAFEVMLTKTSTEHAPWFVIPANRKWYRNLVVSRILIETISEMNPQYPAAEEGLEGLIIT